MIRRLTFALAAALLVAAVALTQTQQNYFFLRDNEHRPIFGSGVRPTVTGNMGIPAGTPFYDTETFSLYYWSGSAWTATAAAGGTFTSPTITGATISTATITSPTVTGTVTNTGGLAFTENIQAPTHSYSLTADAVAQFGMALMVDAGTASRFDVATNGSTLTIGFLGGTGPSAQGSAYPVIFGGKHYCAPTEDGAFTLAHYLIIGAVSGRCTDSAAITTIGKNLGWALTAEPVSNTINPAGCTGGLGCINTALDTPSVGPAGQITLSADVAAAGWAVGDPVVYWNSGGTTPTGLTDGNTYWLVSVSTTKVTIAATKGGAVVVPTTQGDDATQYLQRLPQIAIKLY